MNYQRMSYVVSCVMIVALMLLVGLSRSAHLNFETSGSPTDTILALLISSAIFVTFGIFLISLGFVYLTDKNPWRTWRVASLVGTGMLGTEIAFYFLWRSNTPVSLGVMLGTIIIMISLGRVFQRRVQLKLV